MEKGSLLGRLGDNRFREIKKLKKKNIPHYLHWFLKEDYFSEELLGIYRHEVDRFKNTAQEAFTIFEKATEKIISEKSLDLLGIPSFFHECIYHSWENREHHTFLYGRFDINGGFEKKGEKVIEFNADTCSTLPETLYWQPLQFAQLKSGSSMFNHLESALVNKLTKLHAKLGIENPVFLGSSFGYEEDKMNVNPILDLAYQAGFKPFYEDLENVVFSEEGIFYKVGEEYQIVDVWFKMIPWDWMFNDEPELAKIVSDLIVKNLVIVLNPPYTSIWQNKKFLAYITKHFPSEFIAKTYTNEPSLGDFVKKPVYGRIGENIQIKALGKRTETTGDYGKQDFIFQDYCPLLLDQENYYYQPGVFYMEEPVALNLRTQDQKIMTDDCEFMSHFILI
ncbi:glutathionylspermidine synthase family protein [Ascidiimonas sp. W6]|uniref:glutathionylspermidine synthase family protein n=1 Tax=Ascidiimonas meishanensis TaxID=3128903 RepID=UPI0030EB1FEB